jgi:hypothetical protein
MAGTIEDTVLSQYVPGFRANLNLAPQQTDTRLLGAVDGELMYDTPGQMFNADDVMPSDPEDVTSRVPNTPDKFPGFTRRVGMFVPYQDAAWLDNVDMARELIDPTNKVMASLVAGRWRKVDSAIVNAALGSAYSKLDETGTITTTPLPAAQVVASNDVSYKHDAETVPSDGSAYGMSVGKLIHAGALLDESELEGERWLAWTSSQKADLLRRTPATSRYYNEVMALQDGKIDTFMGFRLIRLPKKRLPFTGVATNPTRQCVAWITDAIVYRGRKITDASIRKRPDKSDTPQAFYKAEHGAVRRYDVAVVEIDCIEGAGE